MTTNEMIWPEVIPGFSTLKMKQEIQDKIYQEIKDMTTKERLAYFHKGSEEFWAGVERRRAEKRERDNGAT